MINKLFKANLYLLLVSLALVASISAQTAKTSTALTAKKVILKSKLMAREMPYNLILPKDYENESQKDRRYPVIYLIHGLFGHFDNWANNTKLGEYAAERDFIIVMPEGDNGWYTDSSTVGNDKYESYIIKELIPEIDKNYRTLSNRKNRAIAGLSMGGYGAMKFGVKYPELFVLAGSFSGAFGASQITDKNAPPLFSKSAMSAFGEPDSDTRKANDLFLLFNNVAADDIKDLPFIYVDCGTEDYLILTNRSFLEVLQKKGIPHEFRELPGKHDWNFWNSQVVEFLQLSAKFFESKPAK